MTPQSGGNKTMPRLQEAERLEALATQIRSCVQCPLHATGLRPCPVKARLRHARCSLAKPQAARKTRRGQPFVGAAGGTLYDVLAGDSVNHGALFITNTVKCRPENNRPPRKREVDTCTSLYPLRASVP